MGFYLRKSVTVGPLRFNLSKSGVGVNSVRYHQEPSAIEAGAWLKLSPMYGSGYTLFATKPANTVVGTGASGTSGITVSKSTWPPRTNTSATECRNRR